MRLAILGVCACAIAAVSVALAVDHEQGAADSPAIHAPPVQSPVHLGPAEGYIAQPGTPAVAPPGSDWSPARPSSAPPATEYVVPPVYQLYQPVLSQTAPNPYADPYQPAPNHQPAPYVGPNPYQTAPSAGGCAPQTQPAPSPGHRTGAIIRNLHDFSAELQAAGFADEGEQLGKVANQLKDKQAAKATAKQLETKQAELYKMQSEVRALRVAAGKVDQLLVKVQVVDLSLTQAFQKGHIEEVNELLTNRIGPDGKPAEGPMVKFSDPKRLAALLDKLQQEHALRILAEPNLVTLSGHQASIFVGGEMDWPIVGAKSPDQAKKAVGTRVAVQPYVLDSGKTRLSFNCEVTAPDSSLPAVLIEGGAKLPSISTLRIETTLEMELGQTAVMGSAMQKREVSEPSRPGSRRMVSRVDHYQTLFLVTLESAEALDIAYRPVRESSTKPAAAPASDTKDKPAGTASPAHY